MLCFPVMFNLYFVLLDKSAISKDDLIIVSSVGFPLLLSNSVTSTTSACWGENRNTETARVTYILRIGFAIRSRTDKNDYIVLKDIRKITWKRTY